MKYLIALALIVLAGAAQADTYTYRCKVDGKSLPLRIDDVRNELTWKGQTYRIKNQETCARSGWRAERPGDAFDFCTATQGFADIMKGDLDIECNVVAR